VNGWHGEQWDFQNNEKTMNIYFFTIVLDKQWGYGYSQEIRRAKARQVSLGSM
jgi:hypothetical protein